MLNVSHVANYLQEKQYMLRTSHLTPIVLQDSIATLPFIEGTRWLADAAGTMGHSSIFQNRK